MRRIQLYSTDTREWHEAAKIWQSVLCKEKGKSS